jgi:O-antigen ligase
VKWVLLAIAIVCVIPLTGWLRNNPRQSPKIWMLVGFLILQHGPLHVYMAIISWPGWPGYIYGAEISLLDLILLAIFFSRPSGQGPLPFKFAMGFYLVAILLSATQASVPQEVVFYAWQFARIFFAYMVICRACADDPGVTPSLLKGMAFGILLATCQAIWERFGLGILRTSGSFGHENFLGVVSHFVVLPFFALLLAGERGWLAPAVSLAGIVIAALTASRATFALAVFGYVVVFAASALRGWNPRKTKITAICLLATLAVTPLIVSSFESRFQSDAAGAFFGTDENRVALAETASMILNDHPMGIGANHFIVVANTQGYFSRAGVGWTNFRAIVHNAYWLVAAETGYLGILSFVILLATPLIVAFRCSWQNRRDQRGDLLLGLGVALLTVYLHSLYEWVFVTFEVQYIFAASVGLIAGLAQQLNYWKQAKVDTIQVQSAKMLHPTIGAPHRMR